MMDVSDQVFACLQAAVTIARQRQVSRLSRLKALLIEQGFSGDDIDAAFEVWAANVARSERMAA